MIENNQNKFKSLVIKLSRTLKIIVLNHLKNLKSIQSTILENSSEQLSLIIKSIRSHQNYYIKLTESYEIKNDNLNSEIGSKLTKIKIHLLKTNNELRLFLLQKKDKNKTNFNQNLATAIKQLEDLSQILK